MQNQFLGMEFILVLNRKFAASYKNVVHKTIFYVNCELVGDCSWFGVFVLSKFMHVIWHEILKLVNKIVFYL